jgi:hypothetical protein
MQNGILFSRELLQVILILLLRCEVDGKTGDYSLLFQQRPNTYPSLGAVA